MGGQLSGHIFPTFTKRNYRKVGCGGSS